MLLEIVLCRDPPGGDWAQGHGYNGTGRAGGWDSPVPTEGVKVVKRRQIFLLQAHASSAKQAQAGCIRDARKAFPGNLGISAAEPAGS